MLKFLDKALWGDTFNTRIKVKFLDYATENLIDETEIEQFNLPVSFDNQLSVFIDNREWVIVKAFPIHADQYSFDKQLTLWIKDPVEAMLKRLIEHPAETSFRITKSTKGPL